MARKTVYRGKSQAKKGADPLAPEGRSKYWFGQKGMDGFHHRSWMKNQGFPHDLFDGRPVIGICNTWSELTPCNAHFRQLAERHQLVALEDAAGGIVGVDQDDGPGFAGYGPSLLHRGPQQPEHEAAQHIDGHCAPGELPACGVLHEAAESVAGQRAQPAGQGDQQ